jgi:hypothetical protein
MWKDLVDGLAQAPTWAQAGIALFVVSIVVTLVGPGLTRRRYRRRFDALARDFGTTGVSKLDEFTATFPVFIDGRVFDVRREYRARSRGGSYSYRGPTGHLLVTSTPLAGDLWEYHHVDIAVGRVSALFGGPQFTTGDAAFDARFDVRHDGVPVRERWLDDPTRAAVTSFFDTPGASGLVWVREQQLQHLVSAPWPGLDGTSLKVLLQRQAALATALERTAGWRAP